MNIVERFVSKNDCYRANAERVDSRYRTFQDRGPTGGMLHSVGCEQPSADVFVEIWNKPNYTVCPHGAIDANTGTVVQTLPWHWRGWHAGKAVGNNTLLGVEMCESKHIRYLRKGEPGYAPAKFVVLDLEAARADCKRTYDSAVELFAMLSVRFGWDPEKDILSHAEGGQRGIASGHADPEHYWQQLNMPFTMDGFRTDVRKLVEDAKPANEGEDGGLMYRVQVGAFRRQDYAEAFLEKVKKSFPGAYITTK